MEILKLEDIKWLFKDTQYLSYVDNNCNIFQFRTINVKAKDTFIKTYNNINNQVIGDYKYLISFIPCASPSLDLNVLGYRTQNNNIIYPWPFGHLNKSFIEQWYVNFIVIRTKAVRA